MNFEKLINHCEKWDGNNKPDSYAVLQTGLVLTRMEIRCLMRRYLSIRDEVRDLERQQKKLKSSKVIVTFLDPLITKRKKDLKSFRNCLSVCGRIAMDYFDHWQSCGATLKDLCNFCNYHDYGFINDEVNKHADNKEDLKFSSVMFIYCLDYPPLDKSGWINDRVDAPFTHAIKEFMLYQMINTPEGRKASDEALKAVFPEMWENALIQQVDENGNKYFTDREGNRIEPESR